MSDNAQTKFKWAPRVLIGVSAWLVGTLPFLVQLVSGRTSRDVEHYFASARAVIEGAGIYTTVPFEYPPYALAWFLPPSAVATDPAGFRVLLGLVMWGLDAAVKAVLIWQGCRRRDRAADLLPFLLYTLATAALARIILQRYDVIPAAMSFAGVVMLTGGWPLLAGMAIAGGAATKLFPAVYFPVMAAFVWRRNSRDLSRFVAGAAIATLPLVAISWMVPWWNFLGFHANRGLEVESVWASVIWLGHFAGLPATWEVISGSWIEVTGPVAAAFVTPARVVWILATLICLGVAVWAASRTSRVASAVEASDSASLSTLAVFVLSPVTAFVAFNPVLSPQFHLWLAPWCALALVARDRRDLITGAPGVRRAVWCILLATFLVPIFYPSRTFTPGLDLGRTVVLVIRNLLLIYATWSLTKTIVAFYRRPIGADAAVRTTSSLGAEGRRGVQSRWE